MKQDQGLCCADAIRREQSNFGARRMPQGCGGVPPPWLWRLVARKTRDHETRARWFRAKCHRQLTPIKQGCIAFGTTSLGLSLVSCPKPTRLPQVLVSHACDFDSRFDRCRVRGPLLQWQQRGRTAIATELLQTGKFSVELCEQSYVHLHCSPCPLRGCACTLNLHRPPLEA